MLRAPILATVLTVLLLAGAARADDLPNCAGQDADRAIAACSSLIANPRETGPRRAVAFFNRGIAQQKKGRAEQAIKDYTSALFIDPNNADVLNNRGLVYRGQGRYDLAIVDISRAIGLKPDRPLYLVNRGEAYREKGSLDLAVADYQRAVQIDARFAPARTGLARTYVRLGRQSDALAALDEAVRIDPRSVAAYIDRGRLLYDMQRYDRAVADLTQALALDRNNVVALHTRGIAYLEMNEPQKALLDLTRALDLNPRYALAYNDRGNVQYRLERFEAAIADYNRALEILPRYTFALNNRGNARYKLGRYEEALADYAKAIETQPTYAKAYANRAETYINLRRYELAAADFRKALELQPGLDQARLGLARVEQLTRVATAPPRVNLPPLPAVPALPQAVPVPAPPAPVAVVPPRVNLPPLPVVPAVPQVAPAPAPPPAIASLPVLPPAGGGTRVALVIGNGNYVQAGLLPNPPNDATDVAATLRSLGFSVIEEKNLTKKGMDEAFQRFAREVKGADVALFFYAGHAMQFQGTNYLMPVDAQLKDEADLPYEMAKLSSVMDDMARAGGIRVAIVDACRDNPLEQRLKRSINATRGGASRGLAAVDRAEGSLVVFATQEGATAADGTGRNSPFTAALLQHLVTPDLEIGLLFRRVAGGVREATGGKQYPQMWISLDREFYFRKGR